MIEYAVERREEIRISLVESNAALRRDLTGALERSGFRVDATARAAEVRDRAGRGRSAVRLLDLEASGVRDWLEDGSFEGTTILLAADAFSAGPRWQVDPAELEILYKPFPFELLESRILARLTPGPGSGLGPRDPVLQTREPALESLLERARRLARRAVPVSLVGEIGTGRRALARRIHAWSPRRALPFVCLDRSSLEALGAARSGEVLRRAVAEAGQGTIVVVEPAEQLEPVQQALRATLRSAGEAGPGWLAIAKAPLEQSVCEGRLLLELQYHLEVTSLHLPPFRERPLDQEDLCRAIAGRVARELGRPAPAIDAESVERLAREGFPGNRMGLESRLRGLVMQDSTDGAVLRSLPTVEPSRPGAPRDLPHLNLKSLERDTIIRALAHWDGNRTRASESLGISVRTLRNKIREYGLR
ncbi:MAG TPA: helix-turn-helix domain-containing protein [Myxococcota bacterium]|nr:helix-turn-helix domain-containing protein [Myxococcota bacterium]